MNLVTHTPCQEPRVRNGEVVPDHGRMHSGDKRECSMGGGMKWKTVFLIWVIMVNADLTHIILEKGRCLIVLEHFCDCFKSMQILNYD